MATTWVLLLMAPGLPASTVWAADTTDPAAIDPAETSRSTTEPLTASGLLPVGDWEQLYAAGELDPISMERIGWVFEQGWVTGESDLTTALRWYERAARAGLDRNTVRVAWMYLGGRGTAVSRADAEAWLHEAIQREHAPGYTALASVLIADAMAGRAQERMPEAIDLLERVLDQGFTTASYFLARVYLEGLGGVEIDHERGAHFARIGAEAGEPQQQGWLAYLLAEGRGVERDPVEALTWASLAAAGGDTFGDQIRVWLEETLSEDEVDEARSAAVIWAIQL